MQKKEGVESPHLSLKPRKALTQNKQMPLTLLVPNPKMQIGTFSFSMTVVCKMIFGLAMLCQNESLSKKNLEHLHESCITLKKNMLSMDI